MTLPPMAIQAPAAPSRPTSASSAAWRSRQGPDGAQQHHESCGSGARNMNGGPAKAGDSAPCRHKRSES
jgi:hypothetical protein